MSSKLSLIEELRLQGITHPDVLDAIEQVPRERFVLPSFKKRAYDNDALPIDCEQTISQPYIVALMTQALLDNASNSKILEIGTGSGYQTAILATLFKEVYTIERIGSLQEKAKETLTDLGFKNIFYKEADGSQGWEEKAPFGGIMVTASIDLPPTPLLEQIDPNHGCMVIPLGETHQGQTLTLIIRDQNHLETTDLEYVSFVPLISDTD